jgi:endonuclease/exonuclease/phosphatase family metal-dependent hydrolase
MKCTYLGQKMLVMDVHLSYRTKDNSTPQSDEVIALRQREMGVIKTWIDGHYNPASDGWLLFMGDMNTSHQEAIFDEWKDGTYGYFARAKCPGGSTGRTYNDWDWENGHVATIDFQFYKGFPSVKSYTIPTATYSNVDYLSDHWPVVVEYRMN